MTNATNVTLLPCPFCGGQAEVREWDWPYVRFLCRCSACKCQARARMADKSEAIAAWNTRTAAEAASKAEIAELWDVAIDLLASLAAAHSILQKADERKDGSARKVVASDTMFRMMIKDYGKSIERARAILAKHQTEETPCTDCGDTGWAYQTEKRCTCGAPASGAYEG